MQAITRQQHLAPPCRDHRALLARPLGQRIRGSPSNPPSWPMRAIAAQPLRSRLNLGSLRQSRLPPRRLAARMAYAIGMLPRAPFPNSHRPPPEDDSSLKPPVQISCRSNLPAGRMPRRISIGSKTGMDDCPQARACMPPRHPFRETRSRLPGHRRTNGETATGRRGRTRTSLRRHDQYRTNSCLIIARQSRDRAKAHPCPASLAGTANGRATTKGGVPCAQAFRPEPAGCAALAGLFRPRQPGCTGQDVRFAPSRIHPLPADQGPANRGAQDRHRATPAERGNAVKARRPPRSKGLPRNPAAATVATERGPRRAARSTGRAAPR